REGNSIYEIHGRSRKILRVAGNGKQGISGNGGPALEASLSGPKGITAGAILNSWVIWADTESHTIRYLNPKTGIVGLLAGTGSAGDGKDGDAFACELSRPHGVFANNS